MARISYADFMRDEAEQATQTTRRDDPRIGFFSLKGDGDSAIVRFMHTSPSDFDIAAIHELPSGKKVPQRVSCLRRRGDPYDVCPACDAGLSLKTRFYIHMVVYTQDPQTGEIVATPKIWDRSTAYIATLREFCNEYGDLYKNVFKITRRGAAGSMETTYHILPVNQQVYREDLYKIPQGIFDNYSSVGTIVAEKTYDEMQKMLTANAPVEEKVVTGYMSEAHAPAASYIPKSAAPAPVEDVMPWESSYVEPENITPARRPEMRATGSPVTAGTMSNPAGATIRPIRRYN